MIDIESVFPQTAALELTYRCNHSCIFCSCPWEDDDTYKQSELSLQEWYAVIDQLIKYGVNYITLTGGEPLTRSDLRNIIEYIHLKNIRLNMISNGRKIDYREFDVNSKISGKPRDRERFVRGSDGRTYYSYDHYETFTEMI